MKDYIPVKPREIERQKQIIEGNILIIGDTYTPYDFNNWREACNYLYDKCYGITRAMTLIKKDKEHLELRCPLTGEYLNVLASEDDLAAIDEFFTRHNLYRRDRRWL